MSFFFFFFFLFLFRILFEREGESKQFILFIRLGKTIQSMSLLAHLAEEKGIWGPFLVVCPKSTLPNWQQEFQKFIPQFKVFFLLCILNAFFSY